MNLFRMKGADAKPLTVLDKAEARLEKILEQKKAANERARETIERLSEEKSGIAKQHNALASRIEKLTSEYTEALDGFKAEEAKTKEEQNVTEKDLAEGRVSVNDFFAVGKRKADIEKESRLAAEEKMEKVRDVIRSLRVELYNLKRKLREIEEQISKSYSELATHFYFQLDSMKKELSAAGISNTGITTTHFKVQEATNDWSMATKGAILHHGKQWKVKSIEEAELIALDPILQERHFEDFRKFLDSIRGLEFSEMNVNYNPSDSAGRAAGEFWMDFRAKVSER